MCARACAAAQPEKVKRQTTKDMKQGLGRWGTGGEGVRDDGLQKDAHGSKKGLFGRLLGGSGSTKSKKGDDKDGGGGGGRESALVAMEPPPKSIGEPSLEERLAAAEAAAEASGLPPIARDGAIHGWVYKRGDRRSKAWKKRYCVYEPACQRFTYYESDAACARDTPRKGRVQVTQSGVVNKTSARKAVERRLSQATGTIDEAVQQSVAMGEGTTKGHPKYEFKFNTADGRVFECYTEKAAELRGWLEAMPHWEVRAMHA